MKITLLTGKTFDIEKEIGFPIEVNCSVRNKRLTLRIDLKKRVPVMNIPRFCSVKRAVKFALDHKDWINNNLAKIPVSKKFEDGENISLFGSQVLIKHDGTAKSGVFLGDGILYVSGDIEFLNRRVRDYIREKAQKIFFEMSKQKAKQINCELNRVCIKDTKTRWGSCSSLNNINYSWRIALAPDYVIDYLMAHEVSHLKHPDHSLDFWKTVGQLCERAEEGRKWLKKNGQQLNIYE